MARTNKPPLKAQKSSAQSSTNNSPPTRAERMRERDRIIAEAKQIMDEVKRNTTDKSSPKYNFATYMKLKNKREGPCSSNEGNSQSATSTEINVRGSTIELTNDSDE